ncbi:LysR family transcriptional regulator [Actinomadura barringtoniae]|uniref:LysR family transcriptional regulator n=1 Tax=Actinomadura barringtoniae TaxID=1427535 RepID=A0A939T9E4_9ACTN|nr:LysR family transcriptional regulator [Actinomadura barringtoniae]MBO2454164.1 LysR family transcriptional regulator [Actinomadura barringtoniae]
MELRDIEIFLTLAEELHFGRTAERLHITASRVSHAVKKQERQIGAPLFERTSRTVRLTPVGERLYQALRPGYRQIIDGIAEVTASVRDTDGTLTLGSMGPQAWMIDNIVDRFRDRHPAAHLVHRDLNPVDPLTPLRSGEIDVAHLWLPVHEPDITIGPVTHTSPIFLAMAVTHPFADRGSLDLEDYGDLTFVSHRSPLPAAMEEAFQPFRTPSGRPIARGPVVTSWDDQLKAVSTGAAVIACPAEAARFYPWPNLVYLPVRDAPPVTWAFAWLTATPNPLVRTFATQPAPTTP